MTALQQDETDTALCLDSPVITTDRLILRPPHEDDAEELALIANNENIARMLGTLPHPYTRDNAREFIARVSASIGRACVYAITEAESGRLIGVGGLHEDKSRHDEPYMGYWLGEPYWGKGYATESARALVDLYFKVTNRPVLMATLRSENDASRSVIEKCGGRLHSTTEATHPVFGYTTVLEHYLITRERWMGQIAA